MFPKLLLMFGLVLGQIESNSTTTTTLRTTTTTTTTTTTIPVTTTTTTAITTTTRASSTTIPSSFVPFTFTTTSDKATPTSIDNSAQSDSSSKSTGVAIGLGVAALVAIIVFIVAFFCIRRNRKQELEPLDFSATHVPSNKKDPLAAGIIQNAPPQSYNTGGYQVYQDEYRLPSGYSGQTEYGQGYNTGYGQYPQAYAQQYPVPVAYDYRRPSASSGVSQYSAYKTGKSAARTPPPKSNSNSGSDVGYVDHADPSQAQGYYEEYPAQPYENYATGVYENYPTEGYENYPAQEQGYATDQNYNEAQSEHHQEAFPTASKPMKKVSKEVTRGESLISQGTLPSKNNEPIPPLPDMRFTEVEPADMYQEYYTTERNAPESFDWQRSLPRSDSVGRIPAVPALDNKLKMHKSDPKI